MFTFHVYCVIIFALATAVLMLLNSDSTHCVLGDMDFHFGCIGNIRGRSWLAC